MNMDQSPTHTHTHTHGGTSTEHPLVVDVLDAEPEAGGESADQDVEVEEEGDPCGGLVLRHRRDDGDVDLGVPGDQTEREIGGGGFTLLT